MSDQTTVGALPAAHRLNDIGDLALALGGDQTSFTGQLLGLIAKADPGNRERLRVAFPRIVRGWELWLELAPDLTAEQLQQLLDACTLTAALGSVHESLSGLQAFRRAVAEHG